MADTIRMAAVQLTATQDRDRNLEHARALMARAVEQDAQVIALPENFSFMGSDDAKRGAVEDAEAGPSMLFLREFAAENSVAIVGGSVPLRVDEPNKVANACLVVAPSGEILARYDKMHMFDVEVDGTDSYVESSFIKPGGDVVTVDLLGVTMGLTICYDVRFPELYRTLAVRGSRVIFVPAAFTVPTGKAHWATLLRARAIENTCYIVAIGQTGHHYGDRYTYGHSMIVDPWGEVVVEAGEDPAVIVADIDLDHITDTRRRIPSLLNIRRDVFTWPTE